MREPTPLFSLPGLFCYPYGAALAVALLLAALLSMASFRKAFGAAQAVKTVTISYLGHCTLSLIHI